MNYCIIFGSASNLIAAEGSDLTVENVTLEKVGEYTCFAINDAGLEMVNVYVYLSPSLLEEPQDVGTSINQTVSFNCRAEGYPLPSITWQKLMNDVFVDLSGQNETELVISSVQQSDAGVYQCIAYTIINGTRYEATANATLAGKTCIS